MAPFAETARLRLRAYRDTDLPLVLALWNDPRVQRTGSSEYPRPRTDKWATEVLAPQLEGALVAVILELRTDERAEDDSDDRFVGYVLLQLEQPQSTRRDAVLAIALSPEWWGRGYGTEALRWTVDHAFRMLGLHRMSLAVMDCNEAAIALYKKIGFTEEGRRRQCTWKDGRWIDHILMGMLVDDWEELRGQTSSN